MSYITPAHRIGRPPSQLFARFMAATRSSQAAADPAMRKHIPTGGLKLLQDAAAGWPSQYAHVALDPETEICILMVSKVGHRENSLCLLNEGDTCFMPGAGP